MESLHEQQASDGSCRESGSNAEARGLLTPADDDDEDEYDDLTLSPHDDARQWREAANGPAPKLLSALLPSLFAMLPLVLLLALGSTSVGDTIARWRAGGVAPPPAALPPHSHDLASAAVLRPLPHPTLATSSPASKAVSELPDRTTRRAERRRRRQRRAATTAVARVPNLVHSHVIPQGGSLSVECAAGTSVKRVRFASFGTPIVHANGSFGIDAKCHSRRSLDTISRACVGHSHCCLPVGTENFNDDPCRGTVKTLAVVLEGCDEETGYTRYKRHCSLLGQPLLCDEDINFLAALSLPPAPEPLKPHVALMVDTSWRPLLQEYVVYNVHNHTGWHVQLFHGPTNGPKLKELFAPLAAKGGITFTDLGSDYMEDWQRLSSMMLIDNFWESVVGKKALVFQPDSIMCAQSTHKIGDFLQYDYVGAPMAGPWWMTSDDDSQYSVGCGGFSLRDRAKSIRMCREPRCITPAAGKLEDQQLGTMWKYLQTRCAGAGIQVAKPSRFGAIRFAVEYDLHMDVLPGDQPDVLGTVQPEYAAALPGGCTAHYYTGPKYDPGHEQRGKPPKWNPHPKPAPAQCTFPHFVPMGCHKCWRWNHRTWRHMTKYCPEAVEMRRLRALYKVGIEFTGWPTRPPVTPIRGPPLADPRYLPVDMQRGTCTGTCKTAAAKEFRRTKLGAYHP